METYVDYNKNALFEKLNGVTKEKNNGKTFCQELFVYKCNDIINIMKINYKSGQSSLRYINSIEGIVLVKQVLETATTYARFFTLNGIQEYIANCQTFNGELLAEYYRVPYQSFTVTKNMRKLKSIMLKNNSAALLIRWAFGKPMKTTLKEKIGLEEFVTWYIKNRTIIPKITEDKLIALELLTI